MDAAAGLFPTGAGAESLKFVAAVRVIQDAVAGGQIRLD
jgi:hypothetical protein